MSTGLPEPEPFPPLLDTEVSYATRSNAFTPAVVWTLRGDRLRCEGGKGPPRETLLRDVRAVQLEYAPTRPERNRYRCRITLSNAARLEFFNRTYRGIYDFEDTSEAYAKFVTALHAELALHARDCRFQAGSSAGSYWGNFALLVAICAVVLGALLFFLSAGMLWVAAIKVMLIVFYLPTAIRWLRRSKPQFYIPGSIPATVLPESQVSA